jgi:hypothetical protein
VGSNLLSSNILDGGNGVKTMPESISVPSSGSFENKKKIKVAKWGTPTKKYF